MVDPRSGNYDNLPHVGPGNMESFTGRLYDNVNTVKDDALISGKFHFNPGDIIYGKINPQLGKYTYAQFEGLASADAYVLNGKNGLTQEFLFGILQTKAFFDYSVSVSMRSGMPKINRDELNAFEFLAPNESEQRAIGDILLKLDDLITLHQRECGKPPFNQSPAWEQRKLGELIQLGGSGGTPSANNPDYYGGDIPFLSIADINGRDITNTAKTLTDEGLQNSAAWIVPSGAVSLAMYASVGKVGIIRQDTATSQAFYNMVFDNEALRDFVFTRLEKAETDSEWEPYISTGTQRNLNADKVKSFSLDVPSNEEASEISAYFANLDTLITLHQRMCPIFSFCAHESRTNFAQTLQGWLQILRYPRPIPKMLVSPSAPASGVFGTAKGAFICASSSAGASTSSPSARKNFITSSTLCCRESLSSP